MTHLFRHQPANQTLQLSTYERIHVSTYPRLRASALVLVSVLLLAWPVRAGDAGSEAIVVYNSRVPESKAIAQHYASVRRVPADQVIGLSLTKEEDIKRTEFRDEFQKPLAKIIADKGWWRIGSTIVQMAT